VLPARLLRALALSARSVTDRPGIDVPPASRESRGKCTSSAWVRWGPEHREAGPHGGIPRRRLRPQGASAAARRARATNHTAAKRQNGRTSDGLTPPPTPKAIEWGPTATLCSRSEAADLSGLLFSRARAGGGHAIGAIGAIGGHEVAPPPFGDKLLFYAPVMSRHR
jgi:hypothetical protein